MDSVTSSMMLAQLTTIFGVRIASIVSALAILVVMVAHGVMPFAPLPTNGGPAWYSTLYTALRFFAGNYGNAAPRNQAAKTQTEINR